MRQAALGLLVKGLDVLCCSFVCSSWHSLCPGKWRSRVGAVSLDLSEPVA